MAEPPSASLGPRYAPEDPTLPKPWMGLIDGSTGLQYYWNPETNVTQYERPASAPPPLPPPLPPGPPPSSSSAVPKLASSHAAAATASGAQSGGAHSQPGQQMYQQQSGAQFSYQAPIQQQVYAQLPYQQSEQQQLKQQEWYAHQQFPQQQSGERLPHQQSGQKVPQQQPEIQVPNQPPGQLLPHEQTGQQASYLQPGPHMSHQQSGQYMPQPQAHQMPYQNIPYQQVQPSPQRQILQPNMPQGGFQKMEESPFQHGKQEAYSTSDVLSSSGGMPTTLNFPVGMPQSLLGVHTVQSQQNIRGPLPGGAQLSGAANFQMQQSIEAAQKGHPQVGGAPRSASQMASGTPSSVMPTRSPMRRKEYGDDKHRMKGDEFYRTKPRDMPVIGMMQPKLAPLPVPQNLQETRIGVSNTQVLSPVCSSGYSMPPMHGKQNMYDNVVLTQPFANCVPMGSSPRTAAAELLHPSAADLYRRQHEVTAMGENIPPPFMTFETTGFPPEILSEMHFAGFLSPTPIQAQTWPVAVQGRDIVAIAKTGSGKTLGYLVPAFLHLRRCRNNPLFGPAALVLAPTRELATQIQDEAIKFGRSSGISCICLYGGAPKGPQLREIEQGADIVVATPGRLNDILDMNKINLHQVSFLVLDEADRMLDMGFEPQIRKIVNGVPPHRQTLMYTATWPKEVRKIAGDLLFKPIQVNIGSINEFAANKAITQYVEVVPPKDKQRRLEQILRAQERGTKIIIFCSTKRLCDQLAQGMGRPFHATAIHGDKSQGERDWALNQFRSGKSPILVATDVAARGLDIKDIRVVINYDFPTGIEDYVHRIGRTGRAGATGISYTFFSDQDWKFAADLVKVLEGANQRVPPEVREMAAHGAPFSREGGISRWESGGGRWGSGSGRGMRDADGGRWDSGGHVMRDAGGRFGGRSGRNDIFGGRSRGRGFNVAGGGGRGGRGSHDRYGYSEGRGRGRFDGHRPVAFRKRGHSYSRSPERGRRRKYNRSRSRSWSRSRSQSRSRSWSRSRSRSRSYSRSPSSRSRSRSRSRSYDRYRNQNLTHRVSGFDVLPAATAPPPLAAVVPPPETAIGDPPATIDPPLRMPEMSPMSPGTTKTTTFLTNDPIAQAHHASVPEGFIPASVSAPAAEPGPGRR